MKILGILRSPEFSPNMVERDAAILYAVKEVLEQHGHEVDVINENDLHTLDYDLSAYDHVYGMERKLDVIARLKEKNGDDKFVNPLQGIIDTSNRYDLLKTFMREGVSMPACALYGHEETISDGDLDFPFWIKRGDGCAQVKEDTSYVQNAEEAGKVLDSFRKRGIERFVVQQHLSGDLIKFYGVEGTDFFDWDYAFDGFSKFGLEQINGKEHGYPFEAKALKALVDEAAKASRMPVYGGDAIVDEHGRMYIIDFNDFPSFARCREDAAKAIASIVEKK